MCKFSTILLIFSISFLAFSKQNNKEEKVDYSKIELTEEKINNEFKNLEKDLKKEKGEGKWLCAEIKNKKQHLLFYVNFPYIELETKITKKWYNKVLKNLDYIANQKNNMLDAKLVRNAKKFNQARNNYIAGIDKILALMDKPEKVSKARLKKLREKRDIEERKKREEEREARRKKKRRKKSKK